MTAQLRQRQNPRGIHRHRRHFAHLARRILRGRRPLAIHRAGRQARRLADREVRLRCAAAATRAPAIRPRPIATEHVITVRGLRPRRKLRRGEDGRALINLMRFEFFVAARYLRAKRRQAVVGAITAISIIGVAVGVASLIIALAITSGMRRDLQNRLLSSTAHVELMRTMNDGIKTGGRCSRACAICRTSPPPPPDSTSRCWLRAAPFPAEPCSKASCPSKESTVSTLFSTAHLRLRRAALAARRGKHRRHRAAAHRRRIRTGQHARRESRLNRHGDQPAGRADALRTRPQVPALPHLPASSTPASTNTTPASASSASRTRSVSSASPT